MELRPIQWFAFFTFFSLHSISYSSGAAAVNPYVVSKVPSRKKGDADASKRWTPNMIRAQKAAFVSAVKSSTVSHRMVTLHLLLKTRVTSAKMARGNPLSSAALATLQSSKKGRVNGSGKMEIEMDDQIEMEMGDHNDTTTQKYVKVTRNYVMHYQDKKSTRTFAEFPAAVAALGVFLDPNGKEASEVYMALSKSLLPAEKTRRKKEVSFFAVLIHNISY